MSEALDRRVRRIEDRIELSDLVAIYSRAIDDRDTEALETLFAADAVFDSGAESVRGRKEVVAHYLSRMRMFGPSYHIPHSQTVEFSSEDEATGIVCGHAELGMPDGAFWVALRYHDDYVRENGRWRFRQRKLLQQYAMPLRQLADDYSAPRRRRWPDAEPAVADLPESLATWNAWIAQD